MCGEDVSGDVRTVGPWWWCRWWCQWWCPHSRAIVTMAMVMMSIMMSPQSGRGDSARSVILVSTMWFWRWPAAVTIGWSFTAGSACLFADVSDESDSRTPHRTGRLFKSLNRDGLIEPGCEIHYFPVLINPFIRIRRCRSKGFMSVGCHRKLGARLLYGDDVFASVTTREVYGRRLLQFVFG